MQKWLRALQPTEIFGLWVRGPKTDHGMCLEMCFCKCGKNLYCPPSRKSTSLLAGEALAGKWADPNSASSTLPWSRGHPAVPVPVFHLNSPCPVVLSSLLSEKMSRLSVTLSGQVLNGNGFGSNRAALRRMQETKSDLSSVTGCLIVTGHLLTAGCLFHQASSTGMSLSSLPLLLCQESRAQDRSTGGGHGMRLLGSCSSPSPHLVPGFAVLIGLGGSSKSLQFSSAVPQVSPWNHE